MEKKKYIEKSVKEKKELLSELEKLVKEIKKKEEEKKDFCEKLKGNFNKLLNIIYPRKPTYEGTEITDEEREIIKGISSSIIPHWKNAEDKKLINIAQIALQSLNYNYLESVDVIEDIITEKIDIIKK